MILRPGASSASLAGRRAGGAPAGAALDRAGGAPDCGAGGGDSAPGHRNGALGSWILAAHSGLVTAAASTVTGLLPGLGTAAGAVSAVTGPALAAYPGVLLAITAVPAWHSAYRELPLLFTGGAMTAAAGLLAAAWPGSGADPGPAARLALLGAVTEGAAELSLEHRLGLVGERYHEGSAGQLLRAARVMTVAGGLCALAARRSRGACVLSAALLAGGGLAAKFAVLRAGVASAKDPRYVVAQQRPRRERGQRGRPPHWSRTYAAEWHRAWARCCGWTEAAALAAAFLSAVVARPAGISGAGRC